MSDNQAAESETTTSGESCTTLQDPKSVQELTNFIQMMLQQMQDRFQSMSEQISSRIDEMAGRIDELEHNISHLMISQGPDGVNELEQEQK